MDTREAGHDEFERLCIETVWVQNERGGRDETN